MTEFQIELVMNTSEYGKYKANFSISVSGSSHKACLDTFNRFKYLVKAIDWGDIALYESKNARKGDVLGRSLQIIYTAFPADIIALREMIERTVSRINIYGQGLYSATFNHCSILRCDHFADFGD